MIPSRAIVCVELRGSLLVCRIFSKYSSFLPYPRDLQVKLLVCVNCPSLREWGVWVSVPCDGRVACPGLGPACALSWLGRCQSPATLSWEKWIGTEWSYLILFIFLKCMHIAHTYFIVNIRHVLGLYLKLWQCFVTRNMPWKLTLVSIN